MIGYNQFTRAAMDVALGKITLAAGIIVAAFMVLLQPALALQEDVFSTWQETKSVDVDHGAWDAFLKTHIKTTDDQRTIIAYGDVPETDHQVLKNYIDGLEAIDPTTLTKEQAYAYWVNFYNAVTVDVILDAYPVKSIRSLGNFNLGPWKKNVVVVKGQNVSLDKIEHGILRKYWRDPRTHYAVNCASYGCPNLQPTAFTVDNTEELLDLGARAYVNHPRGFSVDDRGRVTASSIYKWFVVDFGDSAGGVLDHARQYAEPALRAKLEGKKKINKYKYDWALNEK